MQPLCVHHVAARTAVRECRGRGGSFRWLTRGGRRRHYATAPGSKGPPPPPKLPRASPKPLPFQPAAARSPGAHPKPGTSSSSSSSSSQHQGQKQQQQQPVSELILTRWLPLFGAGAAAVCVGFFTASLAYYWRAQPASRWDAGAEPELPTGRPSVQSPREFDAHLDKSEWRLGITKLRRRVAARARGHVLEVAVGAGRNFDYYDWELVVADLARAAAEREQLEKPGGGGSAWFGWRAGSGPESDGDGAPPPRRKTPAQVRADLAKMETGMLSFTGLDISAPMLDLALTRVRQVVPHMADVIPKRPSFAQLASELGPGAGGPPEGVALAGGRLRIVRADAQKAPLLEPPPLGASSGDVPPQKYDTVIQTFGLCSVRDPAALLRNLAAAVRPGTGRILLLEHGRSDWWAFVNGLLDRGALGHFVRFGCWWNRDIEGIVRAAAAEAGPGPRLEVLRLERPGWFTVGTHVLVELRVRPPGDPDPAEELADSSATETPGWWAWSSGLLSVNSRDRDATGTSGGGSAASDEQQRKDEGPRDR
ncbi:hypothetical protein GGS23DRAFT_617215 [Durotheca rogersii]|uniref:uncharacterized protein n=1 Tax=Durotheca rogersii TaxID=419775 RepID=UPI00221FBF68|nr:uncharacterized protein GGS23DRAFT_617215 [Durotheca rogersii]KAI5866121.1 hypothetical protein GGS23DRAFT_617215 [Durotheca rogersii]